MRHKSQPRMILLLTIAVIVILVLSKMGSLNDKDTLYFVTAEQWQAAFGDEVYKQTIYRNVTIDIGGGAEEVNMTLATANGGLILDDKKHTMKLICVPTDNGFSSYIWQVDRQDWELYDGKAENVDDFLDTYLPRYVDTAMAGLQNEFGNATYSAEDRCYTLMLQQDTYTEEDSTTMHCRIFFENGKLIRLETELASAQTLTVYLYDIGRTKVEAPGKNAAE